MPAYEPEPQDAETVVAGPQEVSGITPRQPPETAPPVLSIAQRDLLAAMLDCIIPAEGDFPGAGAFGVAASVERTLAASRTLRHLFLSGLVEIDLESARHGGRGFVDLDADARDVVLHAVERAFPAFFAALVDHTYRGYYRDPRIHALVGYESRPPQPLGYELPLFDPGILVRQRTRPPFWRPVP